MWDVRLAGCRLVPLLHDCNGRGVAVPGVDDRLGEVMIVSKDAQGRGGEQQVASYDGRKPDPAYRKNAQDFTMAEEEYISRRLREGAR